MHTNDKIFVAGHKGLVGSAIVRSLREQGYRNLVLVTSKDLDLRDETTTLNFFKETKPDYVFLHCC